MKNLLFLLIATIFFGCTHKDKETALVPDDIVPNYGSKFDKILLGPDTSNDQVILDSNVVIGNGKITLPAGTVLTKIKGNINTLVYSLPDGYKTVGRGEDGKARLMAGGSITCNCTAGKGCSPYVASLGNQTSMGCAKTGSCTTCTMTYGTTRVGVNEETLSEVEIIDFSKPLHFVTSNEESKTLISPSKIIMELEEVRNEIVLFAKGYQVDDLEALKKSTGFDDLPSSYIFLQVNVYGRVILLPVQKDLTFSANPLVNELLRDSKGNARIATVYKCKCNNGSSGCSLNSGSLLLAKAVYCDAGSCTSCTLSWL